jgi:hypothetical protein
MKEGFLLDRVALHASNVAPRNAEPTAFVVPDFADTAGAGWNRALMAARVAAHTIPVDWLDELRCCVARPNAEDVFERSHPW